jgi:hypothetical protein
MMNIDSFEGLLVAAAMQDEPQRLLLAFAAAEAEPGPTAAAPRQTLVPVMCVAKQVGELDTFANLEAEAGKMGVHWDVVLVSTLSGVAGLLPDSGRTDAALQKMVGYIQAGQMERFAAFGRGGAVLHYA